MTKLVVVTDLHLDKETLGVPRAPEVERHLWQAVNHMVEIDADGMLCLGDVTDPDNGGASLRAMATLTKVAIKVAHTHAKLFVIIAGNHDVVEDGSGMTTLAPLAAMADHKRLMVVEQPAIVWLSDDTRLVCLPYAPVARAYEPAHEAKRLLDGAAPKGIRQIVAAHLNIAGVAPGEETTEMPRGREVWFPIEETTRATLRLNGHYHARQDFDPGDGGPMIHIPGSPTAFSFGEHDGVTPAFTVIEL